MSINVVIISGNLTRDPEERSGASGIPVMKFGIAVNERKKNSATGEWEDDANFFDVTMFGNRVPYFMDRLSKGAKVTVEGKLRWNQWEKDGKKLSKVDVIANNIEMASSEKREKPETVYADTDLPF